MSWRTRLLAALVTTAALAPVAVAQDPYRPIRFTTADTAGVYQWQGLFERLTRDSLFIRLRDADSISAFSRLSIGSVERQRDIHSLRTVGIGCVALGALLGGIGYSATRDPDSPGLQKTVAGLAFGAGCAVGGLGGLIVAAAHHDGWERWTLPDSLPTRDAALFRLERARGDERLPR
jgi:hypothetical protein